MPKKLPFSVPPLVDYLRTRLGSFTRSGFERQFYCPACIERLGDESSERKFWVNVEKQVGVCYRCEYKFRGFEQLFRYINKGSVTPMEMVLLRREARPPDEGLSLADAIRESLAEGTEEAIAEPVPLERRPMPKGAVRLLDQNRNSIRFKPAFNYLARRKVSDRLLDLFDVHFCPNGERPGHLIFPVYQNGEQVYWTTRSIQQGPQKSWNPHNAEGFHTRQTCILNYDRCVGRSVVSVVEGPHDCMSADGLGLMGKTMSVEQANLLAALVPLGLQELVILLDADAGAAIDKIRSALVNRIPKVSICFLGHGDPDERRDELPELLEKRTTRPKLSDMIRARLK